MLFKYAEEIISSIQAVRLNNCLRFRESLVFLGEIKGVRTLFQAVINWLLAFGWGSGISQCSKNEQSAIHEPSKRASCRFSVSPQLVCHSGDKKITR